MCLSTSSPATGAVLEDVGTLKKKWSLVRGSGLLRVALRFHTLALLSVCTLLPDCGSHLASCIITLLLCHPYHGGNVSL